MMKVHLQGGFGEKGRTSILVQHANTMLMLDSGIKVGGLDAEYHPNLAVPASSIDALIITHAHEDHIGAVCWLVRQGFSGPIYMTEQTHIEMPAVLEEYAIPDDFSSVELKSLKVKEFTPGDQLKIGDLRVSTGHSGHVAGGVWMHVQGSVGYGLVYAGDVVPNSSIFPMSPLPNCDLLLLDASYGIDTIRMEERVDAIAKWINAKPQGALLPTPLSGRSIELISIMPGEFAIAEGMRDSLLSQLKLTNEPSGSLLSRLNEKIAAAPIWKPGSKFPAMPLLTHDGMGTGGPSAQAIEQATSCKHPILCTGHLPPGSPGEHALKLGKSDWLRLPTHPNLNENIDMWNFTGNPKVFGHSCSPNTLAEMHEYIPSLSRDAATSQSHRVTKDL